MLREIASPADGRPTDRERSTPRSPRLGGLKGAGRSARPGRRKHRRSERSERRGARRVPDGRASGGFRNRLVGTERGPKSSTRTRTRAQTSIDFVVGMSVFLLTVAFVVAFLPGVFEPFTATGSGDVLAADRTAGLLAEQLLADPASPGVFDPACTAEFFDAAGDGAAGVAGCQYTTDAADLDAALGLAPATEVNVTIENGGTVQSRGGVALAAGPTPPESESVVVARRVVLLGGDDVDLYVRTW